MRNKILYIDDEQLNLDAFNFVFFRDYDIHVASSTAKAEEVLKQHDIKVVISDQRMPVESGVQFIDRIKGTYPDIVFILLTAHAEIEVIIDAINTGVIKRYILKPYEKEEMSLAISNAIVEHDLRTENRRLIDQLKRKNDELTEYNSRLEQANRNLKIRERELESYSEMLTERNDELILSRIKAEASEKLKGDILLALNKVALVSVTDLDGNITQVNETFCTVCGYEEEELVGRPHSIINSGHHPHSFWKEMWTTVSGGHSWRREVMDRTKHGELFWSDTVITPLTCKEGRVYEYLSIRYLITERKVLHQQRENLLHDLEEYAFITSHKIRGPVTRIMGISMLMNREELSLQEKMQVLGYLDQCVHDLDKVITEMNAVLNRTSYPTIDERRGPAALSQRMQG